MPRFHWKANSKRQSGKRAVLEDLARKQEVWRQGQPPRPFIVNLPEPPELDSICPPRRFGKSWDVAEAMRENPDMRGFIVKSNGLTEIPPGACAAKVRELSELPAQEPLFGQSASLKFSLKDGTKSTVDLEPGDIVYHDDPPERRS